jgi:mannosyltransferase
VAQVSSETTHRYDGESFPKTGDNENTIKRLQQSYIRSRIPWHWTVGSIVFAAALCFNFYRLGTPSVWYDEAFSVELARQPLPLLWHIIFGPEPNMELYYLLLHYWLIFTSLLGLHATEFVVRFPSAIFAAFSSLVVFAIGRRFLGIFTGTLGATLYLLNGLQLTYAQQTRSYALQLLLICIAYYALFTALNSEKHVRSWWILYVVAWALAVYAHLFSLLILLSQLIAVGGILLVPNARLLDMLSTVPLKFPTSGGMRGHIRFSLRSVGEYCNNQWCDRARKQFVSLLISLGSIFVLIIPMLIESLHGPKTGWLPIPHRYDIYHLFDTISNYNVEYLYAFMAFCGLGLLSILIVYLARLFPFSQNPSSAISSLDEISASYQSSVPVVWSLFCWLVIPIAVSYGVSHGSVRLFSSRYLVTIVPALFLLVAFGITTLRWHIIQGLCAILLLVLAFLSVPLYYQSAQVEDWNSTTHWLLERYQSGDGLVCYDNELSQGCQIAVEYYLDAYPNGAHFTKDSPGAFSWENYGPADAKTGFNAALDPTVLSLYGQKHTRFFYIVGRVPTNEAAARVKSTEQWLDKHDRLIDQIVTHTVTIHLYATR